MASFSAGRSGRSRTPCYDPENKARQSIPAGLWLSGRVRPLEAPQPREMAWNRLFEQRLRPIGHQPGSDQRHDRPGAARAGRERRGDVADDARKVRVSHQAA